jgi:hypothetical protein
MTKYYEVLVELRIESVSPKGDSKFKKIKETYLVDAMSVTEAESRIVESFSNSGFSQDYNVIQVKGSKIIDIISHEEKKEVKSAWRPINPSEPLSEQKDLSEE